MAAAVSFHAITAVPSLSRSGIYVTGIVASFPNLQETKTKADPLLLLRVNSPPKTLSPSIRRHLHLPPQSSSVEAAFADTDEDYDAEEEEVSEGSDVEEVHEEEEQWQQNTSPVPSPPGEHGGRLYVGNIPYSMTPAHLVEIFSQAGTVNTVQIVYDRVTDRSRGFAFVTMAGTEDANKAIQMFDGSLVGGRTVKVNFPEVPRGGEQEVLGPRTRARSRGYIDSPFKVYAGNLGWTVTSDSLKDTFAMLPGLLGAKVIYERDSGRSRGYGFVSFSTPEDAQSAIDAMNGKEVQGRPLRLNLASERFSSVSTSSRVGEEADTAGSSLASGQVASGLA